MLSISDWISFLTSEKNPNIGNIIGFTAVIIAVVAVIMSVANDWASAVGAALICVVLMIIYFRTIGKYGRHAKEAGELLEHIMLRNEDIMTGNEIDLSKIEKKWREVSTKGEQKNK